MSNTRPPASRRANPMWGGHYDEGPDALMTRINASIHVDKRLYDEDIRGSIAHCEMLGKCNIIPAEDANHIVRGLYQIKREIEEGELEFTEELEDIHMNVEARLHALLGEEIAGKLHTARSRNDQVAVDFRMFVRSACAAADVALKALQAVLIDQAERHAGSVMPGYTHLQTAQPVTLGHHLHAYIEMFGRDRSRFRDAGKRMNESPLGSAALAGTSFPIDRAMTAEALGFDAPCANSMDGVSARDFALEYLSAASICAVHLSRLAEELVLWCSADFGFLKLPQRFTTGSSIMPQKRNPDAAELTRAKSGSIFGSLFSLLTVMKGLCLTYSKDMQEDKAPVFRAADDLMLCLRACEGMIKDAEFQLERMETAANRGFSTATDLADRLVRQTGMPFRKAHHATGRIVKRAEAKGCNLSELTFDEMQQEEPLVDKEAPASLTVRQSVASRTSYGGTAPECVIQALKAAREKYDL